MSKPRFRLYFRGNGVVLVVRIVNGQEMGFDFYQDFYRSPYFNDWYRYGYSNGE